MIAALKRLIGFIGTIPIALVALPIFIVTGEFKLLDWWLDWSMGYE